MDIVWTDYMKYRVRLRGFDFDKIEQIVRHSAERYRDTSTQRSVAVGRHDDQLVLIPCEPRGDTVIPVTIHATTRQQINFRLRAGRFRHE
jgi:hypothetical protein